MNTLYRVTLILAMMSIVAIGLFRIFEDKPLTTQEVAQIEQNKKVLYELREGELLASCREEQSDMDYRVYHVVKDTGKDGALFIGVPTDKMFGGMSVERFVSDDRGLRGIPKLVRITKSDSRYLNTLGAYAFWEKLPSSVCPKAN